MKQKRLLRAHRHALKVGWFGVLCLVATVRCSAPSNTKPPAELVKPTLNPEAPAADCNTLLPSSCLLPFPSSTFIKKDESTPTQRSIFLSEKADLIGLWERLKILNHDGFSTVAPAITMLPGGFQIDNLPKDAESSLAGDAPIRIINADITSSDYGAPVPFWAKVVESQDEAGKTLLILTPLRAMQPRSRYAVILTNALKKADGSAHTASETMKSLMADNAPEDPSRKALWTYYRDLRWLAEKKLGLSREAIVQMWDFHTRSSESTTGHLRSMVKTTQDWLQTENPQPTIQSTDTYKELERIQFTFKLPLWKKDRDSYINRDADGKPKIASTTTLTATLLLPRAATTETPAETIIFGHGLANSADAMQSLIARFDLAGGPFAAAVMDWDLHGKRGNTIPDLLAITTSLNFPAFAATMQQSANDTVVFAHILDALARSPALKGRIKPPKFYIGQSLGGLIGTMSASIHPTLKAYVLNVTGAGMGNIIRTGDIVKLLGLGPQLRKRLEFDEKSGLPTDLTVELLMAMSQTGFDYGDPISYAPHVLNNRFAGPAPSVLIQQSIGDSVMPAGTTETLARTMKLPLIAPFLQSLYNVETPKAPTKGSPSSGLTQFEINKPGFDAHTALRHSALQAQALNFLRSFLQSDTKTHGNITYDCKDGNNGTCSFVTP